MKKLNIPSAMVGLTFGLIATAFVYLFVPPPSTASADDCDCPSAWSIAQEVNCPSTYDIAEKVNCATSYEVKNIVKKYCD